MSAGMVVKIGRKVREVMRDDSDGVARRHAVTMNAWEFIAPDGRSVVATAESFFDARHLAAVKLGVQWGSLTWRDG